MARIKVFEDCVFELSRLPGVGRKTATRLALHLLKMNQDSVQSLADSIVELKTRTVFCKECGGISEREICHICSDSYRDKTSLCIVEEARDIFVIENTGCFEGIYHVLGGKISPLDGIGPDELRFDELVERVKKHEVTEIIIATNPDVEGETTAVYVSRLFKDNPDVRLTKLASGIPIGAHLEHADDVTLIRAMEGRHSLK